MTRGTRDVAVVGLGAMGGAIAFHLAARGLAVVGFDRLSPPHPDGSSHGRSRAIREAYFEDPRYVPLVRRAYELWADLERASGRPLLRTTGAILVGRPESALVAGARRSAEIHGIAHEVLDAGGIRRRFPAFRPGDGMAGVWEARAGILDPEACVAAHLGAAAARGAELRPDEPVIAWAAAGDGVRVTTPRGDYHARRLVLAAGAWIARLVPDLALPLAVARQPVFWFAPRRPEPFGEASPIWIAEYAPERYVYGFPADRDGVKVAIHHEGAPADPDALRRAVSAAEVNAVRTPLRRFVPDADGPLRAARVCLYTNTPDGHFLVDTHPAHLQVTIVSACSGHGFKFASALGEAVAAEVAGAPSPADLTLFRRRAWTGREAQARGTLPHLAGA